MGKSLTKAEMKLHPKYRPDEVRAPFVVRDLPEGMDIGEALEIYERVVCHYAHYLGLLDGTDVFHHLMASYTAQELKIKMRWMLLAVEHVTRLPFLQLRTTMAVTKLCELLAAGDTVNAALVKMGSLGHKFQIYDLFKKEMHRQTGVYETPGAFRKRIMAGGAEILPEQTIFRGRQRKRKAIV